VVTTDNAILDAATLAGLLREPDPPTVLDASFTLTGGGRAAYDAGHIPGAVFVDVDRDLCGAPGAGGRHPLPDPADLQAALRRLGLRAGHPIVVYEAGGPVPVGSAARVWWTLRWAGHDDVRVLDGGLAAWVAAGQPTSTDEPAPPPGDFVVHAGKLPVWDAEDAARPGQVLIDARVAPRFRGEVEPIDPVAGHIPGAVNQPAAEVVDEHGLLLAPAALRARFEALGVAAGRPVGAYCGSGITAAQTALALHRAGFEPALYVGSWSHWITDAGRPVATGEA
jgi:thiosulfate/3-mercaptopyruvate sulfurtransferase